MRTFLKLFVDLPRCGRCGCIGYDAIRPWNWESQARGFVSHLVPGSMAIATPLPAPMDVFGLSFRLTKIGTELGSGDRHRSIHQSVFWRPCESSSSFPPKKKCMKYLAHFMFPNGGEKKNRIQNSIHHLALYLKDHPRTWIRGDRIAPIDFSHEVRPFGRENDPIFRGRSNDHHGVIVPLNHPSWEPILQGVPHRSEPLEIAHPPWHLVAVWP